MYIYRARHHTNTRLLICIHIYISTNLSFIFLFQDLVASYYDGYTLVEFGDFLPWFKGVSTQFWAETHELKAAYDRGAMRGGRSAGQECAEDGSECEDSAEDSECEDSAEASECEDSAEDSEGEDSAENAAREEPEDMNAEEAASRPTSASEQNHAPQTDDV